MGGKVQYRGSRLLLILILAGLTLSLLVPTSIRAGLSEISPAMFGITANPREPDEVAIRGTTDRSSTGPNDVPIGVVGRATGNASATDGEVDAVGAIATGSASADNAEVDAVRANVTGNALGSGSEVDGIIARAFGDASGPDSQVTGLRAVATGTPTGQGAVVEAIRARADGTPTGPNSLVAAVSATARATSGFALGVLGGTNSPDGQGVRGQNRATSGFPIGVLGETPNAAEGVGVLGLSFSTSGGAGVVGRGPFRGVVGQAQATSGFTIAVEGESNSPDGLGVRGQNLSTSGSGIGILGESLSTSGFPIGVLGRAPNAAEGIGVFGLSFSTSGGTGILGRGPFRGVVGQAQATSGSTIAVEGENFSPDGSAIFGRGNATSGPSQGVVGESLSSSGIGVHGISPGVAGQFDGRVQINCSTPPCLRVNTTTIADLAENLPLAARVAPGDVVVLAEGRGGYGIAPASRPYDTRVAGIVSANPAIALQHNQREQTAPVAMVGIVRAKTTAENGSIRVGDLLTTSHIPGHLMRCSTALQCVGAVVGKALEPLEKGEKQILVMLWRQ